MERKYIYDYHSFDDFYITDRERTPEEMYCPECECSDTLHGVYDDEEEFANTVRQLFAEGRDILPCNDYDEIHLKYDPNWIHPFDVGIFFYIDGKFKVHGCKLNEGEEYGDFIVYPKSHLEIWDEYYASEYKVDFDYYPRGSVVHRKTDNKYIIFHDKCIIKEVRFRADVDSFSVRHALGDDKDVIYENDEHYQCHKCNNPNICRIHRTLKRI